MKKPPPPRGGTRFSPPILGGVGGGNFGRPSLENGFTEYLFSSLHGIPSILLSELELGKVFAPDTREPPQTGTPPPRLIANARPRKPGDLKKKQSLSSL